jgi:hypothetical protein
MADRKPGAKKAPAKKVAATKKAPAKKVAATRKAAKKAADDPRKGPAPKYPRHSIEKALRIPRAVYEQNAGNPVTADEAAGFVGAAKATGGVGLEISSARKYGFFGSGEGGRMILTDRARRALKPESATDRRAALQEAVLAAPDISDVYNFYRGQSLPDEEFFTNALTNRFNIPPDKVAEFTSIFDESIRAAGLLDESGDRPRLIDVGRDESHQQSGRSGSTPKVKIEAGSTCFVMQPFAPPHGDYFESVFKLAIEQAGMTAIRADDEIFGTGKVMDQIWRGINSAKVLVAELTTKNANVFYELGLAHALGKPVVLVSSTQEDVPFDLHQIRVIYYDQQDPFWGKKLIDNVADKIRQAVQNPEDAIFNFDAIAN